MASPKPLFIPWLIEQIDSGQYPGLNWINEEKTKFCIPWKHRLRQDSSNDDVLIFKAWAQISGGEMSSDPSVWKRNFRSTLRVKGFEVVTDNKNDAANPHKAYRLPQGEPVGKRSRRDCKNTAAVEDTGIGGPQTPPFIQTPAPLFVAGCFAETSQAAVPLFEEQAIQSTLPQYYPTSGLSALEPISNILHNLNICEKPQETVQIVQPMHGTHVVQEMAVAEPPLDIRHKISSNVENYLRTFHVSVYYRGVKVWEQMVENNSFRVVFRQEPIQPYSPSQELGPSPELVNLPSPDQAQIYDQKQAKLTQHILDKLGDGLEVWADGSTIYGLRRGDCKAYWSLCKHEKSPNPREVSKKEEQLYTLKEFVTHLTQFINKNEGPSPPCSLFFCLGEKWPDPNQRPWEKKLIMIEVVIPCLQQLKMMAVEGGASSLPSSLELQLSDTPSLLSLLEEMMDVC